MRYLGQFLIYTFARTYVPTNVTPFVIVCTGRTGSNLLASSLDSHPDIICHHEVFNHEGIHVSLSFGGPQVPFGTVEDRNRRPWDFISRVYSLTYGSRAVGFKIGPDSLFNPVLLSLLLNRRVRKIVLHRHELLHVYTSTLIAQQTHIWSETGKAESKQQPSIEVNPARFVRFVRRRRLFYWIVDAIISATRQPHMKISYEEFTLDPTAVKRTLEFLGVDPDQPLSACTVKQNSSRLADRITNYTELCEALRGTQMESYVKLA
jgi:LPS sulfotransferase NodH